jgi:hypothetical protein
MTLEAPSTINAGRRQVWRGSSRRNAALWLLLILVCANLAWEHQTILIQLVGTADYYQLTVREPFRFRILPALLYRASMLGAAPVTTGMNPPFDTSYDVFQLALDTVSLVFSFVFLRRIATSLNPRIPNGLVTLYSAAIGLLIVVFGFFMVPNRALFYPYDFPDLCLAALIALLCVRLQGRDAWLLPVVVFVASMNKETAAFYSGLYLAMRIGDSKERLRAAMVVGACVVAALAARLTVIWIASHLAAPAGADSAQYELHLGYTLAQFRNPLFVFAMVGICSYLYIPIFLMRRRFDTVDICILLLVSAWIVIMSAVGIVRELRVFVPASLLLFVIITRHLPELFAMLAHSPSREH